MNLFENVRIAFRALASNKLRSFLTMLGIIIGVASVVTLVALGNGLQESITGQIEGIGSNLIVVIPGNLDRRSTTSVSVPIYYSDYLAVKERTQDVKNVVADYSLSMQVVYNDKSLITTVEAVMPEYLQVRSTQVEYGRFITQQDNQRLARVVVLGSSLADSLFKGLSPIGREVKISGAFYEVIGVMVERGGGGFGPSEDENAYIPFDTGYERLVGSRGIQDGKRTVDSISVSAASPEVVNSVMVQVERIMRQQHRLKLDEELDFTVFSQNAILSTFNNITGVITAFLSLIAGISLLVGGIGIMNIMLVSVTERTKEIGLRKAVGARSGVILMQFLVETLVLSLFGGVIGITVGWIFAILLANYANINAIVTVGSVLLAFGVAAAVGILFGVYPAFRASNLSPIEALRYE
jgi:putative ABC transport system permease protein